MRVHARLQTSVIYRVQYMCSNVHEFLLTKYRRRRRKRDVIFFPIKTVVRPLPATGDTKAWQPKSHVHTIVVYYAVFCGSRRGEFLTFVTGPG